MYNYSSLIKWLYFVLEVHKNIKCNNVHTETEQVHNYCALVRRYPVHRVYIIALASCDVMVTTGSW